MKPSFVLLLVVMMTALLGCAPEIPTGHIMEWGVFELGPGSPGTREARFIQHTTSIDARLGERFGFRFRLENIPKAATIDLETYVTHPPIKNQTGDVRTHYELLTTIPVNNGSAVSVTGYSFDRPEEMAPGVWTFEHKLHGKTLVSQAFTVRVPR